jgi:hypothetical protein
MLCCYLKKPATARIAGHCAVENRRRSDRVNGRVECRKYIEARYHIWLQTCYSPIAAFKTIP